MGLHRSVGQEENPNYDLCAAAAKARNEAVNRCVKTHLGAGDNAQIADTLHSTLFHPKLQAYSTRVFGDAFLEEAVRNEISS